MNAKKNAKRNAKGNGRLPLILALLMILAAALTGCSGHSGGSTGNADPDIPVIGIVQIAEHPSLDTIRLSIVAQLAEQGFVDGETAVIDYRNAQGDMANLKTICQSFAARPVSLIIAIATPSAQAALGETTEIPIVFSAVTDPLAAGLVESLDAPGGNVTGTSDLVSAQKIMDLALQLTPDIQTVGALYNSSEVNSASVIEELKAYAADKGLTIVEATVTNTSEIQQAAQFLADRADAVFSPTDNTVASAMPVVTETLNSAGIPFYAGADSMVADGALATNGVNYVILGRETGAMAAAVLLGADPAAMPVRTMTDTTVYINTRTAALLDIQIPDSILKTATDLAQ